MTSRSESNNLTTTSVGEPPVGIYINKNNQKKNNDNLANIEDFLRFALILCSLGSSAQELQHI
ncbi:hypothetical protein BCR32DRAFT_287966 [Anaeromyces robustus]|uniref:Uncharacterized protein n=1 Tax=Anaeromyces robustus TaxID=1754192 RepID=A0A1Y1VPI6_9FUNG|nr:hypothetical protein BCR32DRAFT_287966 [Anaeromyces robustus]|eukprot:ORX62497.1 hypothetical protein BCR32DRAFT_287966 [Anaeromyces robustus]